MSSIIVFPTPDPFTWNYVYTGTQTRVLLGDRVQPRTRDGNPLSPSGRRVGEGLRSDWSKVDPLRVPGPGGRSLGFHVPLSVEDRDPLRRDVHT